MIVYRICSTAYANDLNGTGASLFGGRWNPEGLSLLYTASSISLSYLEYLAHNIHILSPMKISLVKIEIDDKSKIQEIDSVTLPADWRSMAYMPALTQKLGKDFITSRLSYVLKVPSAIVPDEYNYLLNPLHPDHKSTYVKEQIDSFEIDKRFLGT
jgi:RES domain-containing protein